ncbi:TIGR00266 family protein [Tepidanaerobacter sp. EBM-38]|uniref:TIGR00266 family protein n=1 Tax=Tepidanaerobacter sp. EBM-38 TaxID=1918496 RepID=UPI000AFE24F4|nr:TIGR00266 family protein [Tepidanaerobacter sp. EBM-38]
MKYELRGDTLPVVIFTLDEGESIFTESGGMSWMSDGFEMKTNMEGGLFGGIARKLAGESLFMTTYTLNKSSGTIAFSSSFPGKIVPIHLDTGESLICQKTSFLCAERSVKLEIHLKKKLGAGLFGGEGFILQRVTGPGWVFLEIDGEAVEYQLDPGEKMKVDTGHVAIFEPSVNFDIETVKGFTNVVFGGEGLFLTTLKGPGKIWLQSMPIGNLASRIIPFIPSSDK